ncbi:hypothetical protein PHPALM_31838 [Phytophthora palmivora]|uniref:Transmembrane protein n=1 Tax=Phytophthora palmivora TaxID=4796 RepID=A0A2P4X1L1_9STRA|nr:hypothetical protein PHPALM_31838 [Phytophthora palmivora]
MQIGRQGFYSVERLESFDQYCKTTSRTRAILVCIVAPLPALITAVLLECLPLSDPSEGWVVNWVLWIRMGLMQVILCFEGSSLMASFIPGLDYSLFKRFTVALGTCIGSISFCILMASTIGFPVPFMAQLTSIPVAICMPALVRLVLGPAIFMKGSRFKLYSARFYSFFFAYTTLIGIYPLYKVFYEFVPEQYRGAVVIVLPVWKFAAKMFLLRSIREVEDYIPTLVAITVDFLSTLFISVCMSTSGSIYFTILLITADIAESVLDYRELRLNATVLISLLDDRNKSLKRTQRDIQSESTDLTAIVLEITRNPSDFNLATLDRVRLYACLPHPLTRTQIDKLHDLDLLRVYSREGQPSSRTLNSSHQRRHPTVTQHRSLHQVQRVSVAPVENNLGSLNAEISPPKLQLEHQADQRSKIKQAERSAKLVKQGLQLLFHCEYLALVEYVECVVPLIFVAFKSILEQLPNIVYYPGGAGNWTLNVVANIFIFASLEIGSLILFDKLLHRRFAISPLHQLAFVLETEVTMVQVTLFTEIVILLQYELQHLGADFSLRFEWLHH